MLVNLWLSRYSVPVENNRVLDSPENKIWTVYNSPVQAKFWLGNEVYVGSENKDHYECYGIPA